ncbi:hypothetical protein ACIGIJ_18900 [Bacillus paranthracis]|uniref:hypothetical protein n=2 Tax=Bacteria TaxID=2 RepID=UPI0037C8E0C6
MTEKKKRTKKSIYEAVKCYYCGNMIERANDLVIKKVPLTGKNGVVRNWNRKLHLDCVSKYNEGLEDYELRAVENTAWDNVYQYFKNDILDMKDNKIDDKDSHLAKRLLGLRVGSYYPSANNTRVLPRGYSFETILIALKVVNPKLQSYLKTANFANFKHKIDGCMRFVVSEIPDVAKRLDTQRKANAKLDEEVTKALPVFDYKDALKKQREEQKRQEEQKKQNNNEINDDISALLGGSL